MDPRMVLKLRDAWVEMWERETVRLCRLTEAITPCADRHLMERQTWRAWNRAYWAAKGMQGDLFMVTSRACRGGLARPVH